MKTVQRNLFSKAVKIMLFISDTQYYVPIKLCRMAGCMHSFIANPFTHRLYPSRPNPSPFAKRSKAIPVKRSKLVTRHNIEKTFQTKKNKCGIPSQFFSAELAGQRNRIGSHNTGPHIYPTRCNDSHTYPTSCITSYIYSASHSFRSICPTDGNPHPISPRSPQNIVLYADPLESNGQQNGPCPSSQIGQHQKKRKILMNKTKKKK